ncbi:MAG: hypothetical protein EPN82_15255 [Bacteroidetes bacterium]|nr:MAG: hypothetical protein EPN82_15255 [Bacteroidota bacterium]
MLIELKAVRSERKFCEQIIEYKHDLEKLQKQEELPILPISAYLLCPEFDNKHIQFCKELDIVPIKYSPYDLLKNWYYKIKAIRGLIQIKPTNHGLWSLKLLNQILYAINYKKDTLIPSIAKKIDRTISTVSSYLKLSNELGLIYVEKYRAKLTNLGLEYVTKRELNYPIDYISDQQTKILREYITKNPFVSPAVFGIYSAVETIFVLSKNYYPVPFDEGRRFFAKLTGKVSEWADKAQRDAFTMYSNYAIELGLLARFNERKSKSYYITPAGIRFILLLELNKSILFVNSL